uniref:Uncharacterized protein n=1 Tax=Medicago truncatula TaxID=3880 RepID=A2Q1A4_MEDTR|nr:hypothetical protein MtrDRAFT_AC148396g31v2 [Medicago truncatula]
MDNTIEQLDQMPQRWCCTPPRAACGGIFRNKEGECMSCFAQNLGGGLQNCHELCKPLN